MFDEPDEVEDAQDGVSGVPANYLRRIYSSVPVQKQVFKLQAEEDGDVEMGDAAQGGAQTDIIDGPAQPSEKPRVTTRYMTKYERARILGTRALQIRCKHDCCSPWASTSLTMV